MSSSYDLIILGAGALGSAAAYHAARRGLRVLLLEQYEIDHQNGSSFGLSRIIRYSYDHPLYVRMAKAAFPMWAELEQEAGEQLLIPRTGGIDIGRPGAPEMTLRAQALAAEGIPYEILDLHETNRRFPQFHLEAPQVALYQADTGVLRASRCVRAHVRLAQAHGADVRDQTPVESLRVNGDAVEVRAGGAVFSGARAIVAAGGWANDLLAPLDLELPLTVLRCQENYFDGKPAPAFNPDRFPAFIAYVQDAWDFPAYGIPSVDGSGVKVAWHGGQRVNHAGETKRAPDDDVANRARAFSKRYLPGANVPVKYARVCLYTMTPDEHFIVDQHPAYPQVVIGAACSGHGFKFSALLGSIVVDLAQHGQTAHDIRMFSVRRFEQA
jgi:sarcosine oxidase